MKGWKFRASVIAVCLFIGAFVAGCGGGTKPKTTTSTPPATQQEAKPQPKQETPPPAPKSPAEIAEERINTKIKEYVEKNYNGTNIDKITVNPNLGTEKEDDYIVLAYFTWNVKNSGKTSREMLEMYSSDMAARMYEDLPEVQELCIFWTVPYLQGKAKISFERKNGGMAFTDKVFDQNFNKGKWN